MLKMCMICLLQFLQNNFKEQYCYIKTLQLNFLNI